MTHDGQTAVVADSDRDALYVVDVMAMAVRSTIALKAGDEPGRLAEDGEGRVHVALRGGGGLVTIDPVNGALLARRAVCPAPRGVAWDASSDSLWVACATGELVQLPAGGGSPTRSLHVERDLRDVIVQNGALSVTSFRSATLLRLGADGSVARRDTISSDGSSPQVAWRAQALPAGAIVMAHQMESIQSISTTIPGGYGGTGAGFAPGNFFDDASVLPPLNAGFAQSADASELFEGDGAAVSPLAEPPFLPTSIVTSVLSVIAPGGGLLSQHPLSGVLPVDIAVAPDGTTVAGVTPGSAFTPGLSTFFVVSGSGGGAETDLSLGPDDQPIAVAFDATGRVILQTREPAKLWVVPVAGGNIGSIQLSAKSRDDTGHDVFHTQAGGQIACASCHPEGGDDGHVWMLDGNSRRTPSLRGTIAGTAPYHWPGDQKDLPTLVNNVYTVRMSGATLASDQMGALTGWVQTLPPPPAPSWVDAKAASAGRDVFSSAATQCSTCHAGGKLTNNQTVDVGTGGPFQVPPLVGVGWRTPLMHDGCAAQIADRFGACSTNGHGDISKLSPQDIANLTAFLETL
jgi:mono/diheme cytochrome c family protein